MAGRRPRVRVPMVVGGMSQMAEEKAAPPVADPAALGLGAFALTTFGLSAHNAGWAPDVVWIGLALFYGGGGQFLGGGWGFWEGQTFRGAAFSSYWAFLFWP